jgi:hypothetical protein
MSQTLATPILDRLLEPLDKTMSLDYARALVEYRATAEVQARVDELADKCNEGELSDAERDEYDEYLQAFHAIAILQQKAKRVLANGDHA